MEYLYVCGIIFLVLCIVTIVAAERKRAERKVAQARWEMSQRYAAPALARNTYSPPEATRHLDRAGYDWTK